MSLEFQFETFVDVYHSIFSEYLSTVIAKLPKENEKYRAMKEELSNLYDKYPKSKDLEKRRNCFLSVQRAKEDIFFKTGCVITAIRIQSFLKEQHFSMM